jgi:hypothetical protein
MNFHPALKSFYSDKKNYATSIVWLAGWELAGFSWDKKQVDAD